ncbi:MAG: peptidylprolyl isomerase [Opitutales bacterium]|nr:peptidylprolyl isomerase [Opitutales bacterium]
MLSVFAASELRAEIYADISVSHGGDSLGTFRVQLFHEEVPRICANFIGLASGERPWLDPATLRLREGVPFYDGLTFHRLMHDLLIQGGSPTGGGAGGPGYVVMDQFHPDLRHSGRYMLSMAHAGPHTTGSQFFITLEEGSQFDDYHSVFGVVVAGRGIIDRFALPGEFPTSPGGIPETPIVIESVVVSGPGLSAFMAAHGNVGLPRWSSVDAEISYSLQSPATGGEDGSSAVSVPDLYLNWESKRMWDYVVLASSDLDEWDILGFGLSMANVSLFKTNVTDVFPEVEGEPFHAFFQILGVDYSHLPDPPASVAREGVRLVLLVPEGELTLEFSGESAAWLFKGVGGTVTSGGLADTFEDTQSVVPAGGFFVNTQTTYARLLLRRKLRVYFDQPVGPRGWTFIEPTLSFHTDDSGWFDAPVTAEVPGGPRFRGEFQISNP